MKKQGAAQTQLAISMDQTSWNRLWTTPKRRTGGRWRLAGGTKAQHVRLRHLPHRVLRSVAVRSRGEIMATRRVEV